MTYLVVLNVLHYPDLIWGFSKFYNVFTVYLECSLSRIDLKTQFRLTVVADFLAINMFDSKSSYLITVGRLQLSELFFSYFNDQLSVYKALIINPIDLLLFAHDYSSGS